MSNYNYLYVSPHDHPNFGPPPHWEKTHHCAGNNYIDDETEDGDSIEYCDGDTRCNCKCDDCRNTTIRELNYDDGPQYDINDDPYYDEP